MTRLLFATITFSILSAPAYCVPRVKALAPGRHAVADRREAVRRAAEAITVYRPLTEYVAVWDADNDEWLDLSELHYRYDEQGRIAQYEEWDGESGGDERYLTTYTYDAWGYRICDVDQWSADGGITYSYQQKVERGYDDVVHSYGVKVLNFSYAYDQWALNYGNLYPIGRNDAGTAVKVERLANLGDTFEPIARVTNTVGADGRTVTGYLSSEMVQQGGQLMWEENIELRNIRWHNTDNQVLGFEFENLCFGANRISSAELMYYGEEDAHVTGQYPNDFEGTVTVAFNNGDRMIFDRSYIDSSTGSYQDRRTLSYTDGGRACTETMTYTLLYDRYGNITEETSSYRGDDGEEETVGTRFDYTYDYEGRPLEVILMSFNPDSGEWEPDTKITASEFVAVGGVGDVAAGGESPRFSVRGRCIAVDCEGPSTCTVIGLDGRPVASASAAGNYEVSLDGVGAGMYVVRVSAAGKVTSAKAALR